MSKFLPAIIFAASLLTIGIGALFFANPLFSAISRIAGEKTDFYAIRHPNQTVWSMRFGGAIAIAMGLFVLWMCWRSH